MLDRVAVTARGLAANGPFVPDANFASSIGWPRKEVPMLLGALGYKPQPVGEAIGYRFDEQAARRLARSRQRAAARPANPDSPFAGLAGLRAQTA